MDLLMAAQRGDLALVKSLIAASVHVNAKDYIGRTALMLASEAGRDEVMKLLKQAWAEEYKYR
jgi:ankyrin repeat protein